MSCMTKQLWRGGVVENRLWCLCHHHGGGGASTLLWNGSRQLQGHRQTPTTCNGRRRRWLSSWKTQKEVQPLEDYSSTAANIPEDLRLPTFADPIGRLLAGLVDFGVACGVGLGSGWLVSALTTVPDLGSWTALTAGTFAWITRDALFEEGNRSLGKILYDIEIAYWDGQLASRIDSVKRNMHYLFVPFVGVHEYVGHALLFCIVWDIATHMVTYDARKLGDYFAGTYVVASPPGRETRVLDMIEQAELEEVEKEIENVSEDTYLALQAFKPPYDGDLSQLQQLPNKEESNGFLKLDDEGLLRINTPDETGEKKRIQTYKDIADMHDLRKANKAAKKS